MPSSDTEPFSVDGGDVGVVLSHGFTGSPASMRPWAEHLAAAGYSVRVPLLPGHGTSWQDANRTRWTDWYAAVESAFDELATRCTTVFAGGLSMGGTLVTRLAEQRAGRLGGLVLVNPSYGTDRRDARLARYIAWAVKSRPAIGGDIKKPGVTESAYDRTPVVAFVSLQDLWRVTLADLGQVTAPVLLFRSREDHVVEPSSARRLQQGATSTSVREVVLENSYHVATLDYDAETIFGGSVEFIAALAPAAARPADPDHPVTPDLTPEDTGSGRRDNGLVAPAYVPLTDVAAELGDQVLAALGRARIPAYLTSAPLPAPDKRRLFVSAEERADARAVVAAAVRGLGGDTGAPGSDDRPDDTPPPAPPADPLTGVDTDAAFADIIADWHVDTIDAVRAAERDLRREDADWRDRLVRGPVEEPVWLDDDHYVPPPPPPLPRLAAPTILAMSLIAVSILLLGLGGAFGLATDLTMLLGVGGVLLGAWMLVMRLRERPEDEDDDGAVI